MLQVAKGHVLNHNGMRGEVPCSADVHDEPDYVFDIKLSCDNKMCMVSSSDMAVHIYDLKSFSFVKRIHVHEDRISNISFSRNSPNMFWTSSDDRTVKFWDFSSTLYEMKPIITFKFEEEVQTFAVNQNDTLLAVGLGCDIHFVNVQKAISLKIPVVSSETLKSCDLGAYSDIHSDLITQLDFIPNNDTILCSSGEDGLICVFDTAVESYEEAVVSILNIGCPIRKFGYFGPNFEGLFALSTVETASFWHYPSAQRIAFFPDLREKLSVDYLVDCSYVAHTFSLQLFAASFEGHGSFVRIEPNGFSIEGGQMLGQHTSTIRCCVPLFDSTSHNIRGYLTGGEDGKLLLWNSDGSFSQDSCVMDDGIESENQTSRADAIRDDTTITVLSKLQEPLSGSSKSKKKLHQSKVHLKQKHKKCIGLRHDPY